MCELAYCFGQKQTCEVKSESALDSNPQQMKSRIAATFPVSQLEWIRINEPTKRNRLSGLATTATPPTAAATTTRARGQKWRLLERS